MNWVPGWARTESKARWKAGPIGISRQRTWGVPIPAFYAGEPILDARIVRNTAAPLKNTGPMLVERDSCPLGRRKAR